MKSIRRRSIIAVAVAGPAVVAQVVARPTLVLPPSLRPSREHYNDEMRVRQPNDGGGIWPMQEVANLKQMKQMM